ncbi:MAG: UDP-N-acetylmuramoyl-tripeptide--D-alanyl-D-alanine ligase [bacterium]|jgi:UDP-N-acetylmuramoyl-tripeptide--D-alanyl-D-alanine ligase
MQQVTVGEIVQVTGGRLLSGHLDSTVTGFATDSRQIKPGDAFVALVGERVDGHNFVSSVLAGPAVAALVMAVPEELPPRKAVIQVEDTVSALLKLGAWYRRRFAVRTVAVTGSTGKTTTKDLIAAALNSKLCTLKNEGNLNTEIGLPLTLFNLGTQHEAAVVELAMRGPGQIARLAQVARPEVGVITNVGVTHIEVLGSQENIAAAKGELLDELPGSGLAILNGDDPWVRKQAVRSRARVAYYGMGAEVDFRATGVELLGSEGLRFQVSGPCGKGEVFLPLPGEFNVLNALAAVAVGHYFGLELSEIQKGLAAFRPSAMRLNLVKRSDGALIIDDSYNANPTSMRGALETLLQVAKGRRTVAVLGDMLELGSVAQEAHREVGRLVARLGVDVLITGGSLAAGIAAAARGEATAPKAVFVCADQEAAAKVAQEEVLPGDVVLIKASRGMRFETVVSALSQKGMEGD